VKKGMTKLTAVIGITLAVSGCEVPVMIAANANDGKMTGAFDITFPAVMLVQLDTGSEELFEGEMIGNITGKATFSVTGPETGVCNGVISNKGIGKVTCDNGRVYPFQNEEPGRMKMSGVEKMEGTVSGENYSIDYISVFGWGKMANEKSVRAAL
jgi:hypothetical protein